MLLHEHAARDLLVLEAFTVLRLTGAKHAQVLFRGQHFECGVIEIRSDYHLNKDFDDGPSGGDVNSAIECHDSANADVGSHASARRYASPAVPPVAAPAGFVCLIIAHAV